MDLRGTGRSQGCLDHLGLRDARDLKQIVEWSASQRWSNGRVGMTGHSYVGSTPSVAAAQDPKGLATIVPSAGLASMYDHQFQAGVPYFLQWAGPIEAYEQIAIERKLPPGLADPFGLTHPGDDFGNSPEETGCGLPQSAAVVRRGPALGPLLGLARGARLAGRRHERRHPGLPRPRRQRQRRARVRDGLVHPPRRPPRRQAVARPVGPRLGLLPDAPRHPVDVRAARVVRQAARRSGRSRPARPSSSSSATGRSRRPAGAPATEVATAGAWTRGSRVHDPASGRRRHALRGRGRHRQRHLRGRPDRLRRPAGHRRRRVRDHAVRRPTSCSPGGRRWTSTLPSPPRACT